MEVICQLLLHHLWHQQLMQIKVISDSKKINQQTSSAPSHGFASKNKCTKSEDVCNDQLSDHEAVNLVQSTSMHDLPIAFMMNRWWIIIEVVRIHCKVQRFGLWLAVSDKPTKNDISTVAFKKKI